MEGGNVDHGATNNADAAANKAFPCMFCSRKFHSSQALGGHQNAHKKERNAARKAKRASQCTFSASLIPNAPLFLAPFNPSLYITAHAANICQFPSQQFSDQFGSNGAPRFDNMMFYTGNYTNSPYHFEEDVQKCQNWQRSPCEGSPQNVSVMNEDHSHVTDGKGCDNQNIDLSLHL